MSSSLDARLQDSRDSLRGAVTDGDEHVSALARQYLEAVLRRGLGGNAPDSFSGDSTLEELGVDSLLMFELSDVVEYDFGVNLATNADLDPQSLTLEGLAHYLVLQLAPQST